METVIRWMEDEDFQRFLYGDPARSPKQVRAQIVGMLGRSVGNALPGAIQLLIDSPTRGPIGLISIQNISWRNRNCSVDIYIGSKSIYRALEYVFDELNMHRVTAFIYSFNRASWRVFESTGARRELTLREQVYRDGAYHDVYGYGLLRPEYEAFKARYAGIEGASLQDMVSRLAAHADA
jgi:RimJ/RimL family protein N-acetyltransferase